MSTNYRELTFLVLTTVSPKQIKTSQVMIFFVDHVGLYFGEALFFLETV